MQTHQRTGVGDTQPSRLNPQQHVEPAELCLLIDSTTMSLSRDPKTRGSVISILLLHSGGRLPILWKVIRRANP